MLFFLLSIKGCSEAAKAEGDPNASPYPSFTYTKCEGTVHGVRIDGSDIKPYDTSLEDACQKIGADYHAFNMDNPIVVEVSLHPC